MTKSTALVIIGKTHVRLTFSARPVANMLELEKIAPAVKEFAREKADVLRGLGDQFSVANRVINDICSDVNRAHSRIEKARTSWLIADFLEPLDVAHQCPTCPHPHAVIAVDGSQIAPGKHEIALCFLINTAAVVIYYGTSERPYAETKPELCYTEDKLYEDYAGRRVQIADKFLGIRRTLAESDHLEQTLREVASKGIPAVALWDGSLIRWTLESEPTDYKNRVLAQYLKVFETAREKRIPIVGYISDPGSKDFVNSLRIMLCPDEQVDCDKCGREPPRPCDAVNQLSDGVIFERRLEPGCRSALFTSRSKILAQYGEHEVQACYLNLGQEVARLEIPKWVAEDDELLNMVHAVCYDQAEKGRGYPVALSQAHERAVVTAKDKAEFFELIKHFFVKHGVRVSHSLKRISKGF
ncbi:MAG: DNA double-strand break repair nuclease NurA [Armatimonadota bacterium]|nr:DNA double-strand break repair nuclease NurA [Armatimonadota bacterium]